MDIDLLFTQESEAGLIFSSNLIKKAAGVLFDTQTGLMTLDYTDMDQMEFNIPIDSELWPALEYNRTLHVGSVQNGEIGQAYQVPLMFLDDPYRGEKLGSAKQSPQPLAAFNHFVKSCISGQPVHREDLADDAASGCILGDASPASLQFAPHLAREHQLEVRPTAAPSAPGMSAPSLGGGSTSRGGGYYSGGGNGQSSDGE